MPGPLLHVSYGGTCFHAAPVTVSPGSPRVKLSGQPLATVADSFVVTGCVWVTNANHPCVKIQWLQPSARIRSSGNPVILADSTGQCLAADQAPQGTPVVIATQVRARGGG